MGQRQKKGQSRGQSGPEAGGFWLLCPFLSTAAQSSVCLYRRDIVSSIQPLANQRDVWFGGMGMVWTAATKMAEPSGGGVSGCLSRCGEAAQGARGGIGAGRPLGQGGSGVPRLGLSPSTVGQWDSGTGTVAVACRCRASKKPERNWRSSPAPASPSLPETSRRPSFSTPSVRRVHGCLHQAADAEASHAQTHSNKRNNRTVSVKKPLLSPRVLVLDLLDWRCLFRRWRFVSVVSFLPRVPSCQTPNLDRQIGPGSARSWDPGAPAKTVWRLWRKKG